MVMAPLWLALALAAPTESQPVTVEIVAVGHVEMPADRYEISAVITAGADTDAAAAGLLAKRKQELLDKVAAAGAHAEMREGGELDLFSSNPAAAMALMRTGIGDDSKVGGKRQASAVATITASTRAAIAQAKAAIETIDGVRDTGTPLSSLNDTVSAMRAAKADALSKARAEADVYAAKLGLGNVVLTGISEKADIGAMFQSGDGKMPALAMFQKSTSDTVAIEATMTVTFQIEPKR